MENTLENKLRFFLQYFNTESIWKTSELDEDVDCVDWELKNLKYLNNTDYLKLKPISKVTENELVECSTIYGIKVPSKIIGYSLISRIVDRNCTIPTEVRNLLGVIDYLRSKGYALPFMNLSVEDLVSYGWLVLE